MSSESSYESEEDEPHASGQVSSRSATKRTSRKSKLLAKSKFNINENWISFPKVARPPHKRKTSNTSTSPEFKSRKEVNVIAGVTMPLCFSRQDVLKKSSSISRTEVQQEAQSLNPYGLGHMIQH